MKRRSYRKKLPPKVQKFADDLIRNAELQKIALRTQTVRRPLIRSGTIYEAGNGPLILTGTIYNPNDPGRRS